jgi:hypothetical protein
MNERPAPPSIRKLPAVRGLAWVSGSWELFRRQPLRLLLVSLFFQFFLSFSQVDVLGLLVILCLPVLSAGMLHAFFLVERGQKPMLAVLFMPFTAKKSVSKLLLLGGVVMVLGLLVVSLVLAGQMIDIDPEILSRIERGDLDALQLIDPQIMENAILSMAIAAAISGSITYFSVPLIWFKNQGTGGAILTGLRALGRNWKPLLIIGLLLGLLAVPIVLLFGSFYLSALNEGAASSWLAFLLLLLGPMFQLLLFGTQYLAFRDIFGMDETATVPGKNADDQLVA